MLKSTDIKYTHKETDHEITVTATINLASSLSICKQTLFGYQNKINAVNSAEWALQQDLNQFLYGEIRKDAQEAYIQIKRILSFNPHFSYEDVKKFDEVMRPLLNIGIKNEENLK
jgi:hypothetical protein